MPGTPSAPTRPAPVGPVSEVGHDALGTINGPNPRIGLTPNTMGNEANTPANKVQ